MKNAIKKLDWIIIIGGMLFIMLFLVCNGCGFTALEKQNVYNQKRALETAGGYAENADTKEHIGVALVCHEAIEEAIGSPDNPMPYDPSTARYIAGQAKADAAARKEMAKTMFPILNLTGIGGLDAIIEILMTLVAAVGGGKALKAGGRGVKKKMVIPIKNVGGDNGGEKKS